MPRGGARQGRPGGQYPNRADLRSVKPLAPTAATGQQYGQAGQQLAAQQQMPIAPQPVPGATAPPAPPTVAPGALGPLTAPTNRPDEPLTAGAPVGLGPNEMNLPGGNQPQYTNARDLITSLATTNPSPSLTTLAAALRAGQ